MKNRKVKGPLLFNRYGTTICGSNGKRTNYQKLHQLFLDGVEFKVIRKSDGRDITDRILENIKKKVWDIEEIEIIKNLYGKHTLEDLHRLFIPRKTVGQIRHKASELSLTVDKDWQKHEVQALSILRKAGVSFPIISKLLQRPLHSVQVKANKSGIVYEGRTNEGLEEVQNKIRNISKVSALQKGKIAEDFTSMKLIEQGFDVFVPYTPQHKTDLIVVDVGKIVKIQVKSAIWDKKTGRFRVPLLRKISLGADKGSRKHYKDSDVDFFSLVCLGIDSIYIVPFKLCKQHSYANLYPHRPKQIQKGFDWDQYRDNFQSIRDFLANE